MSFLFLSVLNGTAISVFAEPEIFFVSDNVVFLAPPGSDFSGASAGDPVIVLRRVRTDPRGPGVTPGEAGASGSMLKAVAHGVIFRVRKEHATVKITSGRAAIGDIVRTLGGTFPLNSTFSDAPLERNDADDLDQGAGPRGRDLSVTSSEARPSSIRAIRTTSPDDLVHSSQEILVYKICNAPRVVADQFDRNFSNALLSQDRITADAHSVVFFNMSPVAHMPSSEEIISTARKRHGAGIVIVPVYVRFQGG